MDGALLELAAAPKTDKLRTKSQPRVPFQKFTSRIAPTERALHHYCNTDVQRCGICSLKSRTLTAVLVHHAEPSNPAVAGHSALKIVVDRTLFILP